MSPEDLLKRSDADLERLAGDSDEEGLQKLFNGIWEKVRPLYVGQPKSVDSAFGLSLSEAAVRLASHRKDNRWLIEAWHMMGRSLGANEQFEESIP